jgi:uncharacterized membrane protein
MAGEPNIKTLNPPRVFALDVLRVFAIVMMIIFHFIYDLKYFGYVAWDTPLGNGFRQWRSSIVFCFVFAMGISMGLAHGKGRRPRAFWIRLGQIFACALLISAVTLFMFPESWIYFGILHFMVIASLFTFALVRRPWFSLLLGSLILVSFWAGWVPYGWPINLISGLPGYTEDFASPFPWLGVAFIGSFIGQRLATDANFNAKISCWKRGGWLGKLIGFAGQRSLSIYMLHQPVLFGLILSARLLF